MVCDVNNDGYEDVIVGAYGYDGSGATDGRAYVYLGGTSVSTEPIVMFTGSGDENLGWSVSPAGDVNNDGYTDFIVGAYLADAGGGAGANRGEAYIYYGGNPPNSGADVPLSGDENNEWFGYSVSLAGDVNGDGYSDVIVGIHRADPTDTLRGEVQIFFGGNPMNGLPDVTVEGETGDQLGYRVSTVGDVNGDGYTDVIMGAPHSDTNGVNSGKALVLFGGSSMDNVPDLIISGEVGDMLGIAVGPAGDVNNDGFGDIIVGASKANSTDGAAYVFYGGASMDNIADVTISGSDTDGQLGVSVACAGNVNNDAYDDVIVGAYFADGGGSARGEAYLFYGGPSMGGSASTADKTFQGKDNDDHLGFCVSSAGDVNNDGYDDLLIGADDAPATGTNGEAYIFFGAANMDTVADWTVTGEATQDHFGEALSGRKY